MSSSIIIGLLDETSKVIQFFTLKNLPQELSEFIRYISKNINLKAQMYRTEFSRLYKHYPTAVQCSPPLEGNYLKDGGSFFLCGIYFTEVTYTKL